MKHKTVKTLFFIHLGLVLLLIGLYIYLDFNQLAYVNKNIGLIVEAFNIKVIIITNMIMILMYAPFYFLIRSLKYHKYRYHKYDQFSFTLKWIALSLSSLLSLGIIFIFVFLSVSPKFWPVYDYEMSSYSLTDDVTLFSELKIDSDGEVYRKRFWIVDDDTKIGKYIVTYYVNDDPFLYYIFEFDRLPMANGVDIIETDLGYDFVFNYKNHMYNLTFLIEDDDFCFQTYTILE